jgi:dihydrodipicolinate synthase/N-acetylneuraminate lyase
MSRSALPRPLRGIVPPMATPLSSMIELDVPGLERLVEHILQAQVHALFLLGTTGEGPALSYSLRKELTERVCRQVRGRVPVLVGITDASYAESLRMCEVSAAAGADAIVAAPPFYYPISQADLFRLIEGLAETSPLPLYLYNQPELTKVSFSPEIVARASELPNVWGLKDSSGDMEYLREVIRVTRNRSDFSILVGPEHLLAEALLAGAHGGVPGGANIFPHLPVLIYQAFLQNETATMHGLQAEMVAVGLPIWKGGESDRGYLRRLKCALSVMGLCSGLPCFPYRASEEEERLRIDVHLKQHRILKASAAKQQI